MQEYAHDPDQNQAPWISFFQQISKSEAETASVTPALENLISGLTLDKVVGKLWALIAKDNLVKFRNSGSFLI